MDVNEWEKSDDLLVLKEHKGIPIVLPRQFWEILKSKARPADS